MFDFMCNHVRNLCTYVLHTAWRLEVVSKIQEILLNF